MAYRAPVGDGTYCYTPNCSIHFRAWEAAVPQEDDREALMRDLGIVDVPRGRRRETPNENAADVIKRIPEDNRTNISADQLESIFEIMQEFGTYSDDAYGFRAFVAKKDFIHEWSERGADIRYFQRVRDNGDISEINLYRISGSTADEIKIYRGQAALRHTVGLEEYTRSDREHIAEEYWTSSILPTLGNMPGQGARFLREQYIDEIVRRPELVPEVLDAWEKTPRAKIQNTLGSGRTFIDTVAPVDSSYNGNVRSKLLAAIDSGDKKQFNKVFKEYGKHLPRRAQGSVEAWAKKFSADQFAAAAQDA